MISPKAQIADTAIIHENVTVEDDVIIHDYVVIYPNTVIKSGCEIYDHCVIGKLTPDLTWHYLAQFKDCISSPYCREQLCLMSVCGFICRE